MPRHKQQGFTLIELMVVLIIVGIATAAVSISIKPDPRQLLRKDANRLIQMLQIAQAEARADGRPITWEPGLKGFRFSRRDDQGLDIDHFSTDAQLHPRAWESASIKVRVMPRQSVVLTAEWFNPPLQLELSDGRHRLTVQRTAGGQLQVVDAP